MGAIVAFIFLILPLIIFDFKYNFVNFKGIKSLFVGKEGSLGIDIFSFPSRIISIYSENLVGRYLAAENLILIIIISILVIIPFVFLLKSWIKNKKIHWPLFACFTWLIIGILGLAFYKGPIYDHYLGFMNPVPFLLLGALVVLINSKWKWIIVATFLIILTILNLNRSWIFYCSQQPTPKNSENCEIYNSGDRGEAF